MEGRRLKAIVYLTTPDGTQKIAGTLRLVGNKIVASPSDDAPGVRLVLRHPVRLPDGSRITTADPEAFLRALPGAFSGTYVRVGLEE